MLLSVCPTHYYKINSFETAEELSVLGPKKIKFLLTRFLQFFPFRTHKGLFLVLSCSKAITDRFSVLFPALGFAKSSNKAHGLEVH